MTPQRIEIVVKKLLEIAATNFSDYAGFHLDAHNDNFSHCFIINDLKMHSSNFTIELEEFEDAVKIITEFRKRKAESIIENLEDHDKFKHRTPLYLHYLKLKKDCEP